MRWGLGVSGGAIALCALAACATAPTDGAGDGAQSISPIVGRWRQVQADCPGAAPIPELIFRADGRFGVTWTPFETYQDYWGGWTYNSSSSALTLSVDGGNYIPSDGVPAGRAHVADDVLTFETLSLGSPRPEVGARCDAPFRR